MWIVLAAIVCPAQQDVESRLALLIRVQGRMRKVLARIPDYTCAEVITRSVSHGTPPRVAHMDRLRLEVAVVGGQELFAWPGAARFEREDPLEIVGSGPIGTGEYAGFLYTLFLSDWGSFSYGEKDVYAGRPVVRYDYRVPRARSAYTLRDGAAHAVVGYHGSFWVDEASEQVVALDVRADDIPEMLDMSDVRKLIDYKLARLGDQEFPFPDRSEVVIQQRPAGESRCRIEFSGCRQYTAESTLRFGDSGPLGAAPVPATAPLAALPPGLTLDVALDTPIDVASSAAGDAIFATLTHSLRAGALNIPKGARLVGRMLRLEIHLDELFTLAAFDFSRLEFGGTRLEFRGHLREFDKLAGLLGGSLPALKSITGRDLRIASAQGWKNPAVFTLRDDLTRIPRGFRMRWETQAGSR